MRVVAGKYRGKVLKEFDITSTRPTTDRVKESIFNLIQFDVVDSIVLDLFSGTGALGVEAVSRGAKKVFCVDKNIDAVKLIRENFKGIEGDYEIQHADYESFLKSTKTKFDIVLLDPPYMTDYGVKAIDFLIANDLLSKDAIIIFETSEDKKVDLIREGFKVKIKKYGKIVVYKMVKD